MANKKTVAMDDNMYKALIRTIANGTGGKNGKRIEPNPRVAAIIQIEKTTGIRLGDVLQLRLTSFVKSGNKYYFNIKEQKTGKARCFLVPACIIKFLRTYAEENHIADDELLFPITSRAVSKTIKKACDVLGDDFRNVSSHSARKTFGTNAYEASGHDLELVRRLLQHSSAATTARYLNISDEKIEKVLMNAAELIDL